MRAKAIQEFSKRGKLQVMNLPVPDLGPKDDLIKTKAAGVHTGEWKIREGFLLHEFPIILEWDAAIPKLVERGRSWTR